GVRAAMRKLPELEGLNLNAGQLEQLFKVVERLDGFPRHIALHPSGIVLSGQDLVERVPMERSFQGFRMVQADKDDVELLGLVKSDMVTPFIKRRHGLQRATYAHPLLRPVLQESNGVVVYHEQVMRVLSVMGGYDLAKADQIRRHLDDEGATEPIHVDFVKHSVQNGLSEED